MGNMVNLQTTVADLMRVASMSGGIISNLGAMIGGLGSSFNGRAMLDKMGIESGSGLKITPRGGSGIGAIEMPGNVNQTVSESGYIGNANSSDIKNYTISEAKTSEKRQMIKAKEDEPTNQIDFINGNVLKIYKLLNSVASGTKSLRVRVDSYGLTGTGSLQDNSLLDAEAQGGIAGLTGDESGSSAGISSGSVNNAGLASNFGTTSSGSSNGAVNLGGWTML
jgi:hypothetical protein